MGEWILVVMLWTSGSNYVASINKITFHSQSACLKAREMLEANHASKTIYYTECVEDKK